MRSGEMAIVNFALGDAAVRLITRHKMRDGETVWHVEDEQRKHGDFVGESHMKRLIEGVKDAAK